MVLITQQPPKAGDYHPDIDFAILPHDGYFAYALNARALRKLFRQSGADLLHVHYAGGYGATVWLSGIRERMISVWGRDVYHVPFRSFLHRLCVVQALKGAMRITSTSHVMAEQVRRLGIRSNIDVIAFGVDTALFSPRADPAARARLVVGTVKTLQPKYGIDTLIQGFALSLHDPSFARLNPLLRIFGGGEARAEYEGLVRRLRIAERVEFAGAVNHEHVPDALRGLDIYVAVSCHDIESFGVAVIEASACGLPVIMSDAGGLPEVVEHGSAGFVLPRNDPVRLAGALCLLAGSPALRQSFGAAGRIRVSSCYEWNDCVDQMIAVYREVISCLTKDRQTSVKARPAPARSRYLTLRTKVREAWDVNRRSSRDNDHEQMHHGLEPASDRDWGDAATAAASRTAWGRLPTSIQGARRPQLMT